MKKMIKKLVAVMVMGAIFVTPVFARDRDLYWNADTKTHYKEVTQNGIVYLQNHITGELSRKTPMERATLFEIREIGDKHKVNVMLKNGVAMVAADELAEVFGLNYYKDDTFMGFYAYTAMSELEIGKYPTLSPTDILVIAIKDTVKIKKNEYRAETSETELIESLNGGGRFYVKKKGALKTPFEVIDGKIYVPAREVIELINEAKTEIIYDGKTDTITFVQLREWYNQVYSSED